MSKKEYILCAAIHFEVGEQAHRPRNISNGIVITGRRHHNCLAIGHVSIPLYPHVQGFLTSEDRFVDRKVGNSIAILAGQKIANGKFELFSEDLY